MSTVVNQSEFDVFLSYDWEHKEHANSLYDLLTKEQKLKVCAVNKESVTDLLAAQLAEGIIKSRVFLCCITWQYSQSEMCKKEIGLAELKKKSMIILMPHPLHQNFRSTTNRGSIASRT